MMLGLRTRCADPAGVGAAALALAVPARPRDAAAPETRKFLRSSRGLGISSDMLQTYLGTVVEVQAREVKGTAVRQGCTR